MVFSTRILMMLASILLATVLSAGGNEPLDPEVAALQGVWEMQFQKEGQQIRVVKEIKAYRETVRAYCDGQLTQEHTVDFELERAAGVRIFRWKNGLISAGPRKGQKLPDGGFVYRLRQDEWTGVFGLLDDSQGPVFPEVYRRAKPADR
jgi:hypothetical protein